MRLTNTQEQILQLLMNNPEEQYSIRKIARTLCKSYTLTYNNIQELIKRDFLETRSLPPAQIISLKKQTSEEVAIRIEHKKASELFKKYSWIELYTKDVLSAAVNPFFILLIFGSYAKETPTKNSDIDILIIMPTKEEIKSIEHTAQQYTKVKKSVIILDATSFVEMIKNTMSLNVGNEAKKHHVILYGVETYYQLLQRAQV